jgi:Tat protein translocase TatC
MAVMSLGEHLEELRRRLIRALVAVGVVFLLCWLMRERLLALLVRPHEAAMRAMELNVRLNYSSYFEPVVAQMKACLLVAVGITGPYLIYEVWAFVAPGLFPHERHRVVRLALPCVLCFMASLAFGYFLFVPVALRYLLTLSGPGTEPVIMIASYLSTLFLMTIALGVAFQTPIVVYCLIRWGVVDARTMQRHRRAVVLAVFVVAAVLTPPDPVTQLMMAATLMILYDLGTVAAAPTWETLRGSLRVTGLVLALGGGAAGWFAFWPVAQVTAVVPIVHAGGAVVAPEGSVGLRRGAEVHVELGGGARVRLGSTRYVLLEGPARLRVHGPGAASLLQGRCLAANEDPATPLTLNAGPAAADVADGRLDVALSPSGDRVDLVATHGEAQVKTPTGTQVLRTGRSLTVERGGRPVDASGAGDRWRDLMPPPP